MIVFFLKPFLDSSDFTTTDTATTVTELEATTAFTTTEKSRILESSRKKKNVNDFDDDLTEIDETETEKCKNISSVPICGEGQEINFDPFGRPICVCRNYHFFILETEDENNINNSNNNTNDSNANNNNNNNNNSKNDSNDNNNNNDIDTNNNINNNERKSNNNNNNNNNNVIDTSNGTLDVHDQISVGNILGKFPDQVKENCYIPGSQGENIFVF